MSSPNFYALKWSAPASPVLELNAHEASSITSLLHRKDKTALVFSSDQAAERYAADHGLAGAEPLVVPVPLGYFLAQVAGLDHCRQALLDGSLAIGFFSCVSGYYWLPSHFLVPRGDHFEALHNDNRWHREEITSEAPLCGCGDYLCPYTPSFTVFSEEVRVNTGLFQAVTGQHSTFDGTGYGGFVCLDLRPPAVAFQVTLDIEADGDCERRVYDISAAGLSAVVGGGKSPPEAWDVCPLSGLVRLFSGPIYSREGIDRITVEFRRGDYVWRTELREIPLVQYESVPDIAREALETLRQS
jgi:hypothetical protein